ncbi:hypothetical protein VTL71DRAFT_8191 [Oculimacula yallundae]|uniref:LIM zinc-binding domain-containing protein n=1 Tax=Oculimacula yallundae TaxID=86028 RepID=A0ABR4CX66_9HELO
MSSLPTPPATPPLLSNSSSYDTKSAFICTICWQSQPLGRTPKLLGSSARIVCRACWRAVLDLSICWVCGECIVRGDEVISLGWCFWHRACFGCLVCGTRLDVPGEEVKGKEGPEIEKGEWGKCGGSDAEEGVIRKTRCIGVELEEIPLCTVFEVETLGESDDRVLERGLETVTKSDGGLSRSRLDMLSEGHGEATSGLVLAPGSSSSSPRQVHSTYPRDLKRFSLIASKDNIFTDPWGGKILSQKTTDILQGGCHTSEGSDGEETSPLLKNAANMGISEDGSMDDCHSHSDTEMSDLPHTNNSAENDTKDDIVYVSVLDPLGETAFRPSKTKPLPKWMNLLPNNVHKHRKRRYKTAPEAAMGSHETEQMQEGSGSYNSDGTDDSETDTPVPGPNTITPSVSTKRKAGPSMIELPPKVQKRATIAFDPTPRGELPDDSACLANRRSYTTEESPCPSSHAHPCDHPSRPSTPYPRSPYPTRPSISRNETTSYFSHRSSVATIKEQSPPHSSHTRYSSPDSSRTISPMKGSLSSSGLLVNPKSPSQSSEYLDRYQPKPATQAKYEKYVAGEAEPILEKIKRQIAGEKGGVDFEKSEGEKAGEKVKEKEKSFVSGGEEAEGVERDPKRKDLTKELRDLFSED